MVREGGKGEYSIGALTLFSQTTLYIYVGGMGNSSTASPTGGFNGGGSSYIGGVINDSGITAQMIAGNASMILPNGDTKNGNAGSGFARITKIN